MIINEKKQDKRNRIIKAATKVFAENGFYNAKISQISHIAGVADGTIYLYFKSKDDILISIFEEEMQEVIDYQIQSITKGKNAKDKLLLFAKNHANMVINNFDLATFIQLEIRQSNKFMKNYENIQFANYLHLIADIINEGITQKEFSGDINVHLLKHAFFGGIDEISTQWVLLSPKKRFNLSQSLQEFCKIFIRGIQC